MKTIALLSAGLAAMLVALLPATPAQALNNKSWVSSTGGGATCTRASPCASLQTAHDQTNPGGEIGVVDSGEYGLLVIGKAISIIAEGVDATILSGGMGSAAITFSGSSIPTDVVTLQGLIIDGLGAGGFGISWPFGPALVVKNCVIRNFKASGGFGISVLITTAGLLSVTDTMVVNNGTGLTGGGIQIKPTGSGVVDVVLNRVQVEDNPVGVKADGSGSTGVIQVSIRDSVIMGSKVGSGVTAVTTAGQATTTISISRSHITNNGTGVLSNGALAAVLLSNSTIQANGVALSSAAGGALFSYKNNDINNNGTPGSAPTVIPQN